MKVTYEPHHWLLRRLGDPYAAALAAAGHEIVPEGGDVLLVDADAPWPPYKESCDTHRLTVLHPHGLGVVAYGAGQEPRHPRTVAAFAAGAGHVELAQAAGDVATFAAGWPWTALLPFRPVDRVRRVFFAPAHASKNGHWLPGEIDAWREAGTTLMEQYPPLDRGGNVIWHVSQTAHPLDITQQAIREADLVATASSTVLALAVACGRPVVYFGAATAFTGWDKTETEVVAPRPALRRQLESIAAYPYGPADAAEACQLEAVDWRSRFVGSTFDPGQVAVAFDKVTA